MGAASGDSHIHLQARVHLEGLFRLPINGRRLELLDDAGNGGNNLRYDLVGKKGREDDDDLLSDDEPEKGGDASGKTTTQPVARTSAEPKGNIDKSKKGGGLIQG